MGKSAIREVLESINPFKKKKKKVNPMVADVQTVDFEALGLGAGLSALLEITVMGAYVTALAGAGKWRQRR